MGPPIPGRGVPRIDEVTMTQLIGQRRYKRFSYLHNRSFPAPAGYAKTGSANFGFLLKSSPAVRFFVQTSIKYKIKKAIDHFKRAIH